MLKNVIFSWHERFEFIFKCMRGGYILRRCLYYLNAVCVSCLFVLEARHPMLRDCLAIASAHLARFRDAQCWRLNDQRFLRETRTRSARTRSERIIPSDLVARAHFEQEAGTRWPRAKITAICV